jgi:hypothetical protein
MQAHDIAGVTLARRAEPAAFRRAPRPHGPRTRREHLAFLRWSGEPNDRICRIDPLPMTGPGLR